MNNNWIAGIDFSMTSPSICIGSSTSFEDCEVFFHTSKNKFSGSWENIHGIKAKPYSGDQERYHNLSEWALSILKMHNITRVCIEGYSMGSKSGLVLNIAENGGLLKHKLWKAGIQFINPAPTSVKKFFTGKGNSNKIAMHDAFVEKTGKDISLLIESKKDGNPVSDIVDSYAMYLYGRENFS